MCGLDLIESEKNEYDFYEDEEYYNRHYSSHDRDDDRYTLKDIYGDDYYDEFDDY